MSWREWATTDVGTLVAEWSGRSYPAAGIECEKSRLVVIDEDTLDEFQRLARSQDESIPDTYTVRTGRASGGRQFYFEADGHGIRNTKTLKLLGFDIDVKGAGGYVVAAGSLHPSGATYQVERDVDPVPFPTWLVELLNEQPGGATSTSWTDPDLDQLVEHGIPAGQDQDDVLRDVVWKLRGQYLARSAAWAVWDAIVARTVLTKPEPWTGRDFARHWEGADKKIPPPPTVIGDGTSPTGDQPRAPRAALTGRVFSRGQLAQLPEPEPLIGGTIDQRTVAVVAGPPGSLKSFTLLSWACSIATGTKWLSRPIDHPGRVLLIAAEGAYGIHHRIEAWEDKHCPVPDEALTVVAGPINLLNHQEVTELCAVADGHTFVAVDTLARCMVGGDENSARDMGQAVDSLYRIRDATAGGCVAAAHHTPQSAGHRPRGSTALLGGVDTCYMAEGGPQQMTLNRVKRKDGPTDDTLTVQLELRLKSGLLADKSADISGAADKLLSAFVSAFSTTGCSKAELRLVAGQPPATFYRSLNSLLSLRLLANDGTEKRPHYKLGSGHQLRLP